MIEVDRYILENIENTLRLCANHFNSCELPPPKVGGFLLQ